MIGTVEVAEAVVAGFPTLVLVCFCLSFTSRIVDLQAREVLVAIVVAAGIHSFTEQCVVIILSTLSDHVIGLGATVVSAFSWLSKNQL